ALEVDLEIAPATRGRIIGIPLSLGSEALHRGPRLDESTIDAEVFARQESLHSRLSQNRIEELRRGIALEEPIAVFREHRVIPDRIVDRQANEPAKQQVELHPLRQLPLGADRVESCKSIALRSISGGIEGRPVLEYSWPNPTVSASSAPSAKCRIAL